MSYNEFFGFSDSPFLDVPDLKFLFLTKQHEVLLAELAEFITSRQGIALVNGDDGVGKTMLAQALIQRLLPSCQPIVITRPAANPLASTLIIAQSLAVNLREGNLVNLAPLVHTFQDAARQGKFFLMLFDDAHLLMDQHLEEIYFLSQMEHQGQQLLPIMLVGRNGLGQKLDKTENQCLRELVHQHLHLTGLNYEETTRYIDHRLNQVGSSLAACFADGCSELLFDQTGGIPRRINQVCDQVLNRAWQENCAQVTRDLLVDKGTAPSYESLTSPPEMSLPESYEVQATLKEEAQEIVEDPPEIIKPPASPPEQSFLKSVEAQATHKAITQKTVEGSTRPNVNFLKSTKVTWHHFLVMGAVMTALVASYLLVFSKPPAIKQEVTPPLKASEKPSVSPKAADPSHSPPSQHPSAPPSIPGEENLLALLKQVREAQLKKDINLFLKAYSPTFTDLSEKKKDVLTTWKKYDYLDLHFNLDNIQQKNANTIVGRVVWKITLEDVQSKIKRILVKDYIVHFSNSSGKWLIQSSKEKD